MMTAQDLANIRSTFDSWLPDTCVITEVTLAEDSNGTTETRSTRASDVPCRFATLAGRELERAQQVAAEADTMATFQANRVVAGTDELTVTRSETGEVFELQVLHVVKRSQEMKRQVYCKDLNPT
jgi:hypothetical protein